MSKNISISDEVYERLTREKGDRSFSELISDTIDEGSRIEDVTGQRLFDADTYEAVKEEIDQLSDATLDRIEDEAA